MYKTFKTRIYPNKEQISYLKQCFGYYRFVYNWGLEHWYDIENKFNRFKYTKTFNEDIENDINYIWTNRYNKSIKQESLLDLEVAIKNHLTKLKLHKHSNLKFRSKHRTTNYFRMHVKNDKNFIINGKYISIHTCKTIKKRLIIKMNESVKLNNRDIKNVAISERNNKYYIHISYIIVPKYNHIHKHKKIGLDLGYKNPIVSFNGSKVKDNYNFPKEKIIFLEKKIARYQNKMSKQKYGYYYNGEYINPSNRCINTITKINKLHLKIYNIRKDWREKLTTKLAKKYKNINIDVPDFNLTPYEEINKSMYRVGLYDFVNRLMDKVEYYNGNIITMPNNYKSTQTCSNCNHILKGINKLNITDRIFICPECGLELNRDINASKNIYNYHIRKIYFYKIHRINMRYVY